MSLDLLTGQLCSGFLRVYFCLVRAIWPHLSLTYVSTFLETPYNDIGVNLLTNPSIGIITISYHHYWTSYMAMIFFFFFFWLCLASRLVFCFCFICSIMLCSLSFVLLSSVCFLLLLFAYYSDLELHLDFILLICLCRQPILWNQRRSWSLHCLSYYPINHNKYHLILIAKNAFNSVYPIKSLHFHYVLAVENVISSFIHSTSLHFHNRNSTSLAYPI